MEVKPDDVKNWLCEAATYETEAAKFAHGNQPGPAMTYYFLAAQMLTMCAAIIGTTQTQSVAQLCEKKCDSAAVSVCAASGAQMSQLLQQKIQELTVLADQQSAAYCQFNSALMAPKPGGAAKKGSNGGSGGEDDDEKFMKCECSLRNNLEHQLIAKSANCEEAWFDLIIGQQEAKDAIVNGFQNPLIYPNLFPNMSKAVLFYGSPGTGKTMLARALTNELSQAGTVRLLMFAPQHSDIKGKWVGESEKKIHRMFKCASEWATQTETALNKANATSTGPKKPFQRVLAVIFFDEVEALAGDRAADKTGLVGSTLNTLLQEMDGVKSQTNVVVVAATNYPWQLDAAFLRRFTSRICVTLPTDEDLYKAMCMSISKHIYKFNLRVDPKRKTPEEEDAAAQAKAVADENCDNSGQCSKEDRSVGKAKNDSERYKKNPFVRHLNEMNLRKVARDMAAKQYSLSDLNNVMARVVRDVGSAGVTGGIFLKRTLPWSIKTPEGSEHNPEIYISKACFEQTDMDREPVLYRLKTNDTVKVLEQRTGDKADVTVHYQNDLLILPGTQDARILDNDIYVDSANKKAIKVIVKTKIRLNLKARTQEGKDMATNIAALQPNGALDLSSWALQKNAQPVWGTQRDKNIIQHQKNAYLNKKFQEFAGSSVFTPELLRKFRDHGIADNDLFDWISTTKESIAAREENVFIEFFLEEDLLKEVKSYWKFWNNTKTAKALDTFSGLLLGVLCDVSKKARFYSDWNSNLPDYNGWEITEPGVLSTYKLTNFQKFLNEFSKTDISVTQLIHQRSALPLLNGIRAYTAQGAAIDSMFDDNYHESQYVFQTKYEVIQNSRFTLGIHKETPNTDPATNPPEFTLKNTTNLKRLKPIPEAEIDRVVNWDYNDHVIWQAFLATPSSADPQMISLINLYKEDPAKVLTCMTETRMALPETCKKMVAEEQAKKAKK